MPSTSDQHVLTSLQNTADWTIRPERKKKNQTSLVKFETWRGYHFWSIWCMKTHFHAATDVIQASIMVLTNFPPNAPPSLLTWQLTRLAGMANVSETAIWREEIWEPVWCHAGGNVWQTDTTYLNWCRRLRRRINFKLRLLSHWNNQYALSLHVEMLLATNTNRPWTKYQKVDILKSFTALSLNTVYLHEPDPHFWRLLPRFLFRASSLAQSRMTSWWRPVSERGGTLVSNVPSNRSRHAFVCHFRQPDVTNSSPKGPLSTMW